MVGAPSPRSRGPGVTPPRMTCRMPLVCHDLVPPDVWTICEVDLSTYVAQGIVVDQATGPSMYASLHRSVSNPVS